jgi:hypothetical protein
MSESKGFAMNREQAIDLMRDVYMTREQREAYEYIASLTIPKDTTELSKRIGRVPRSGLGVNELATTDTTERDALLAEIKKVVDYGVPNGWYEVDSLLIKIRKHLTEESK